MRALEGFRVLDMTLLQQGPAATTYLADMGAEVIKIEDPVRGDPARGIMNTLSVIMHGVDNKGINFYFETHNRNKKGIAINLKNELGRQAFYKLVTKSDAFVSNYRYDALEALGLDYKTLSHYNPKLIYATGSGYGQHGPDKDRPTVDLVAQARSGLMLSATPAGYPPIQVGRGAVDQIGGLLLAFGIVIALLVRERTGIGQEVHSSLLRAALLMQAHWLQAFLLSGQSPENVPRDQARDALFNLYRGKDDRWFIITDMRSAEIWPEFCHALNIEYLIENPEFATYDLRLENSRRLISILDEVFATRTAKEWVKLLQDTGFWCDLVCTYDEVAKDPQVLENKYIVQIDHPIAGRIRMQGVPVELSKTAGEIRGGAPQHGQHTEEVLIDIAGYTWDELEKLKQAGAII